MNYFETDPSATRLAAMQEYKAYLKPQPDHLAVVEDIIKREIAAKGKVSKLYVMCLIPQHISYILVYNYALAAGTACDNGPDNIQAGAKALYRLCMRRLSRKYTVGGELGDGWITAKAAPVVALAADPVATDPAAASLLNRLAGMDCASLTTPHQNRLARILIDIGALLADVERPTVARRDGEIIMRLAQ